MRRFKAFTLVEVMIVVMIIGLLLAIAVPQWVRARDRSRENACLSNLREIDHSKQRWALENRMSGTDTPSVAELAPDFLKSIFPTCPSSGVYSIRQVDQVSNCSIHGDARSP